MEGMRVYMDKIREGTVTFIDIIDILFDLNKQKHVRMPDGYTYEIYNKYQISILKNGNSFSKIEVPYGSDYSNCTVYISFAHDENSSDYNFAKRVLCESRESITQILYTNTFEENERFCKELINILFKITYDEER